MIELPFGIVINLDFSFWVAFLNAPFLEQVKILFAMVGWLVLAIMFLKKGAELWAGYRESTRGMAGWEWVVLAVDIPAMFIQTPKAVEQIFAHLSGALGHTGLAEKYWHGHVQKWFSFEVISIEGYIQFLVRTEKQYRDLVEASIYAQYTEAEITEVEDYVNYIPDSYPNSDYDVMGVEFKLSQDDAYPLRTYPNFEYNISKDAVFSDPMAAILENFTRVGRGEHLWMQIVVEPADSSWKEKGIEIVKNIMSGDDGHGHGGGILDSVANIPQAIAQEMINIIHWNFEAHGHEEAHDEKKKVDLSPGMKKTIEGIEDKISKLGFKSKLRVLYAARKDVFSPNRCIEGFVGAMNQFHIMSSNAIVPYMGTHASYDSSHKKSNALKTGFVKAYKNRKMKWKDCGGYMLNIEELATVWHFPLPFVKAPLVQKAGAKRAEPPSGLPVEFTESPIRPKQRQSEPEKPAAPVEHVEEPPEDLPYG